MKVEIVTWYYNPNYGGLVQAYALQEIIKKLGYESEFVNYRPDLNTSKKRLIRHLKDIYIMLTRPELYKGRKLKYKFIREKLNVGKLYYYYDELSNEADKLVEDFKKYVNKIRFLSVREEKGAEIIKSITSREAKVVLDPSLLISKEKWLQKIKDRQKISPNGKYILLYILGENNDHVEYAKKLSEYTGYEIIALETKNSRLKGLKTISGDPFDFIELLNNASYILTDSFHGVALSINLEKQFATFKRFKDNELTSQNSRIYNILNKMNLTDRLISTGEPLSFFKENIIDYDLVTPLLEGERKSSLEFLSNSIESVINGR